MEKVFEDYKGVILFYIVVIVFSLLFTIRINNLNQIGNVNNSEVEENYYA